MSKHHWIMSAGAGMALLLTSCASKQTITPAPPAPQAFKQPTVPAQNLTLPPVKIAGMIQTSKAPLMPVAIASKRDPFASVEMPGELRATFQPAPAATPQSPTQTIAAKSSNIGTQSVVPLPQPQPIRLNPVPPITVSAMPTPPALPVMPPPPPTPRTNLAESISFTGVVQTGSNLSAIVQDTDGTSRYVQMGETLAGGEVTVKRISLNSAGIPSIVLLHNGIELIKSVSGV